MQYFTQVSFQKSVYSVQHGRSAPAKMIGTNSSLPHPGMSFEKENLIHEYIYLLQFIYGAVGLRYY